MEADVSDIAIEAVLLQVTMPSGALFPCAFNFRVTYIPSGHNQRADVLSRKPKYSQAEDKLLPRTEAHRVFCYGVGADRCMGSDSGGPAAGWVTLYHTITCCPPNSPNQKCNWLPLIVHHHVSALDPAGPKYTRASPEERLDPGDALFVEAIHTDSDNFGIRIPVGHIDYYLNGGKDQPGCSRLILYGYQYLICDHMRAVHFYISVLKDSCPMMAFPCSSYKNFLGGHCLDCFDPFLLSCPTLGLLDNGGLNMKTLPREVKVYLATAASAPYCVHHTLVEFHLQQRRASDTNIEITLLTSNSSASTSFIIPKQQMLGKGLLIHSAPLCQIESVMLQHHHKFWKRKKDEPPIVGHFCTAPLPVDKNEKMMCLPQVMTITNHNPLLQNLNIKCD
ncbi:phospholipase A1 member A [Protobothrops mucrosquamatus]|uniref:phospholipase A1 member A n=1 Tax=Protobothrops mucrosquamatus TaxID=103944 RepID=UPI000775A610|nr:phospholipase A1 member A [Protobothrops mucrosquamatus]